jgi:hypothetical protein
MFPGDDYHIGSDWLCHERPCAKRKRGRKAQAAAACAAGSKSQAVMEIKSLLFISAFRGGGREEEDVFVLIASCLPASVHSVRRSLEFVGRRPARANISDGAR